MSSEKTTNAAPVDGIVIRPFLVPTGDVIRGLLGQMEAGVVTVNLPDHGWPETLKSVADYLDQIESGNDG